MGREPADVSAVRPDPHPPSPAALVVDAGTTTTKVALVAPSGAVTRLARFPTTVLGADPARNGPDLPREAGTWGERLDAAAGAATAGRVAVATTAPGVVHELRAWARGHGDLPVRTLAAATVPLAVDYRPPSALGPDRLADAVAAVAGWGAPVVVVAVGTAITCDLVDAGGRFAGGAIAPGPVTGGWSSGSPTSPSPARSPAPSPSPSADP